jgi:hypothetical protein
VSPLDAELGFSGCRLSGRAFKALLARQFRSRFFTWGPAELRRHPVAARRFCERVRAATGAELPDTLIWDALLKTFRLSTAPLPA